MENDQSSSIADFFKRESSGGILLIIAAILALFCANTSLLAPYYDLFLSVPLEVRLGEMGVAKPLLLWINDGLMAIFFFLVGLELKRELIEGELSDRKKIMLPGIGAVGGMVCPALIYFLINKSDPTAIQGWAIPTATDIAFALGVLALLGSRVPASLKVFLTSLAIFDDIGAVIIIAIFYTAQISGVALLVVAFCIPVLVALNRRGVTSKSAYMFVGMVMWLATLKSGVHATLAGVLLAMFIPLTSRREPGISPLKSLEEDLHSVVAFFVLPTFAFANAGLNLKGVSVEQLFHGVPLGIALGLFFGKQIGVFGFCWLFVKLKWAALPTGMNLFSLYGTAVLCGIGFTMSLFIGSLAFQGTGVNRVFDERLGIILGSVASGVLGYLVLRRALASDKRC